jgi:hypothetical protein
MLVKMPLVTTGYIRLFTRLDRERQTYSLTDCLVTAIHVIFSTLFKKNRKWIDAPNTLNGLLPQTIRATLVIMATYYAKYTFRK